MFTYSLTQVQELIEKSNNPKVCYKCFSKCKVFHIPAKFKYPVLGVWIVVEQCESGE